MKEFKVAAKLAAIEIWDAERISKSIALDSAGNPIPKDRNDPNGAVLHNTAQILIPANTPAYVAACEYAAKIKGSDNEPLTIGGRKGDFVKFVLNEFRERAIVDFVGLDLKQLRLNRNHCMVTLTIKVVMIGDQVMRDGIAVKDDNGVLLKHTVNHVIVDDILIHISDSRLEQLADQQAAAVVDDSAERKAAMNGFAALNFIAPVREPVRESKPVEVPAFVTPVRKASETDAKYEQRLKDAIAKYRNKYGIEPEISDPVVGA